MTAISARNLAKRYVIGSVHCNTLRDQISSLFRRKPDVQSFWALKDVSFDIAPGETVGLIGKNGAGKSTLLKVLSQITMPTSGEVRIRGTVASLLEVGTGFHPELSGRENIYMSGSILGMSRREIRAKFDEIVDFAEVSKFLDTPVKHYSSGMYVRLAFSVAAHLQADILFVDEVLAVGDGAFQKKCLGKMSDVSRGGKTVIFVSHSMAAMQMLCGRCIWLNEGSIVSDGPSSDVISKYLHANSRPATERVWDHFDTAPGCETVRLHKACVQPQHGSPSETLGIQAGIEIRIEYWNKEPGTHVHLGLHLFNDQGINVFCTNSATDTAWHGRGFESGKYRSTCLIPPYLLNDGNYRVKLFIVRDKNRVLSTHEDLLSFEVVDDDVDIRIGWFGKWPGIVRPRLEWRTEHLEPQNPTEPAIV